MSITQVAVAEHDYVRPSLTGFLFSFWGRISRHQYWVLYFLPYLVLLAVMTVADIATGAYDAQIGAGLFSGVFSFAALWPSLAIAVKRCHDRDRSGLFLLISLIPIVGAISLFVELGCLRGSIGTNRFGSDPVLTG